MVELISNVIDFILRFTPILITVNIVFAIVMMFFSYYISINNKEFSKIKRIGSIICFIISILSAASAIINSIFAFMLSHYS
ncbi:hypothetical protein KQI18_07660 [Clostridioides mangenotii]|uniref:hypothetical protein n=1 Tax=Metaclostridioides mangenotii TaxID=1540 RepID=UPI001C10EC0D|nr:hypothetical protein [Clostridioides mangenotii]MBU5307659.1 hypothetical protein [Clostridioides mangenotii]